MRIDLKRALLGCLVALLLIPAAASATFPVGDRPEPVGDIHGPGPGVPAQATATAPRIVREVHNITTRGGSQTVPVVLAALALSVAIGGAGYVTLRIRPLLRS